MVRLSALALAVLLVCTPLSAELHFAAERPLAPPVFAPVPGAKGSPAADSDGDGFLVAWVDRRSDTYDVVATRVSPAGEVLDRDGIVLLRSTDEARVTSLRWNGTAYDVGVWIYRSGSPFSHHDFAVTSEGIVSPADGPRPHPWPRNEHGETLEFTGAPGPRVLWFIDASGKKLAAVDVPYDFGAVEQVIPAADGWIVVYLNVNRVRWARYDRNGGLIRSRAPLDDPSFPATIHTAVSGSDVGIAWYSHRHFEGSRPTRLSAGWITVDEGGLVRSGTLPIGIPFWERSTGGTRAEFEITGDGTAFHVATTIATDDSARFQAFRIADGSASETTLETVDTRGWWPPDFVPALATGARNLLAWRGGCDNPTANADCQVVFTTFDHGGSAADRPPSVLSTSSVKQDSPVAAGGNGAVLTAWRDVSYLSAIRARFTSGGPVLDVSTEAAVQSPRVAFAAGVFAVSWIGRVSGRDRVMVRRYDASGNALDAAPVAVSDQESFGDAVITARGESFQLAWLGTGSAIRTANLPATGTPGPIVLVATPSFDASRRYLALTSAGNVAHVVWSESYVVREAATTYWRSVRITGANVLGPQVELGRSAEDPARGGDSFAAALRGDGALLFVRPISVAESSCYAHQLFAADGQVLRDRELFGCSETGDLPRGTLVWDGGRWWIGSLNGTPRVQAIAADGTPGPMFTVPGDDTLRMASIAPLPAGLGVLYTYADEAPGAGNARRAFLRVLTDQSRGRAVRH